MTWICGNCGASNSEEAEQCGRCGAARASASLVAAVATPPGSAEIAPPANGAGYPGAALPAAVLAPPDAALAPPDAALAAAPPPDAALADAGAGRNGGSEPPGEVEPEPGTATAAAAEQPEAPDHPIDAYWTVTPPASPEPPPVDALPSSIAARPHTAPLGQSGDLGTAPLTRAPETVPQGYSAADAPTQILSFDLARLHPLPVGALLDGRYMVKAQVQMLAGRNLYRAEALSQQRCPSCGFLVGREATTCPRCETPLTGDPPCRPISWPRGWSRKTWCASQG